MHWSLFAYLVLCTWMVVRSERHGFRRSYYQPMVQDTKLSGFASVLDPDYLLYSMINTADLLATARIDTCTVVPTLQHPIATAMDGWTASE